jgi:4a-hydroxytetrahydrobiopterin dehydratase
MNCPLVQRDCVPCQGGVPPLEGEPLRALLAELGGGWKSPEGRRLEKEFLFPDFKSALAFADQVGELAESVNHHPELAIAWGRVAVAVWTHKIGGLSESDFVFAAKVDRLAGA